MKKLLFTAVAVLLAVSAPAQDWAKTKLEKSPRHGEFVKIKHDKREVETFVTYPEIKDKATVVIVVHEIYGLSDWARAMTDELAAEGYIALAPDLLSGMGPNGGGTPEIGQAGVQRAIGQLPAAQITADLDAVVEYAKKIQAGNGKIAIMGFCWGGNQVFRYASNSKELKAVLSFYGNLPTDDKELAKITAPVYGFYGEMDNRITGSVPKGVEQMKAAGKTYEPVTYAGAGHGFMRSGDDPAGSAANKKARDDAFKRALEILKKL